MWKSRFRSRSHRPLKPQVSHTHIQPWRCSEGRGRLSTSLLSAISVISDTAGAGVVLLQERQTWDLAGNQNPPSGWGLSFAKKGLPQGCSRAQTLGTPALKSKCPFKCRTSSWAISCAVDVCMINRHWWAAPSALHPIHFDPTCT